MKKELAVLFLLLCWVSNLVAQIEVKSQSIELATSGEFEVMSIGFSIWDMDQEESGLLSSIDDQSTKVVGQVLNYPNPVSFAKQDTQIGYYLEEDLDITIQIVDQIGNEVYRKELIAEIGRAHV